MRIESGEYWSVLGMCILVVIRNFDKVVIQEFILLTERPS